MGDRSAISRAILLLAVAGALWWSSNVAFLVLGISADGWGGAHQMWDAGFRRFPIWVKQVYASVGGPVVLVGFVVSLGVCVWRRWCLASIAILAVAVATIATTRVDPTTALAAFAWVGVPVVLLGIPMLGGILALDGRGGARRIAGVLLATTLVTVAAMLPLTWIFPFEELR